MGEVSNDLGDYDGPEGLAARVSGVSREAWEIIRDGAYAAEFRANNDEVVAIMREIVLGLREAGLPVEQIRDEVTQACENLASRGARAVPVGPMRELLDRVMAEGRM